MTASRLLALLATGAATGCLSSPAGPGELDGGDPGGGGDRPDAAGGAGGCPVAAGEKAAVLTDDFADGQAGPCWRIEAEDPGCSAGENAAGTLVVTAPPDAVGRCGYQTTSRYDLTDNAVLVEVLTTPRLLESYASLELRRDAQNKVVFRQVQLDMHCFRLEDGIRTDHCLMSYDASTHRWWRLRHDVDRIVWERSTDAVSWYELGSTATPFDVSSVTISLGVTSTQAPGTDAEARFDRYNLPP